MVDGRSRGKDGKRCSVPGPGGLKAGAGLRGPYGTSVRHTWPTWALLVPAVTLISTLLFLSLRSISFFLVSLSPSSFSLPGQRSSPLSISHKHPGNAHVHSIPFSLSRTVALVFRFLAVSLSLFLSLSSLHLNHPSRRNLSFRIFCPLYYMLLIVINVYPIDISSPPV